jgi:hypothetical protein
MNALRDFVENLAEKPYCCSDLKHGLMIRNRSKSITYPYIQPNHVCKISWLVFDVDRSHESALSYLNADLPDPNLIIKNPSSGNCHLLYRLEQPIWTHSAAGKKAQDYYHAIRDTLTDKIGADKRYCGLICKNPLHNQWITSELHNGKFALVDLEGNHTLRNKVQVLPDAANTITGRNCTLFDLLRFDAYKRVNEYRNSGTRFYDMWLKTLENEAHTLNSTFSEPLPLSEVRATAKSVAKWTWRNYEGTDNTNRGKMGFGETRHTNPEAPMLPEDEIKRRQSLSAQLTNKHRKESTELQIKQAIERLNANGEKLTNSAIAKQAGLNRQTMIKNYGDFIAEKVSLTVAIR